MNWLRLIRFPNLLIVALTQYLLEYLLLLPHFQAAHFRPLLDEFHFFLLVITTILIAAGGYVINDLEDVEIDKKNKPEKQILGNSIAIKMGVIFYYILVVLGFLLALYLAVHIDNLPLVLIYPSAVFLLWIYSKKLKRMLLLGNLTVATFCAFVAGIIWFAERVAFYDLGLYNPEIQAQLVFIFSIYMIFAFLSTLYREIIKDIEDIEGDAAANCQTFPIRFGIKKSKVLVLFIGCFLILLIVPFIYFLWNNQKILGVFFSIMAILLPVIFSLIKLRKANSKRDFHQLSQLAKFIMLGGIFLLIALK